MNGTMKAMARRIPRCSAVSKLHRSSEAAIARGESARRLHYGDGAGDLDQMQGIDDAVVPTRAAAMDRLRELEVGIHAGRGGNKPGAQVVGGVCRILLLAGNLPGRDKRR